MSKQKRGDTVDRVISEHKAASTKLDVLKSQAMKWGEELSYVAQALKTEPQSLIPEGESLTPEFLGSNPQYVQPKVFDCEKIVWLAKEIRGCMKEVRRLELKKQSLDF
jgi:hypothetical protein